MADFHQNLLPTFTLLDAQDTSKMEQQLIEEQETTPMGVIIPSLFSDLQSEAMAQIIKVLASTTFLKRIYISLDKSTCEQFIAARAIVEPLGDRVRLLYNDSPDIVKIIQEIEEVTPLGNRGKGRAVWTALGYAQAVREVSAVAFHDADIVTYDRDFLIRLLYPVVRMKYQFVKGFYARYNEKLNGRVVRLFYFPFLRSLREITGDSKFLQYMADFRYPLSGEFAMFLSTAAEMRIPSDWGLEVSILSEIYRLERIHRIAQIELTSRYDHKHQEIGSKEEGGLVRMASDIARTFFSEMSSRGMVVSEDFIRTLKLSYIRAARSYVGIYGNITEMTNFKRYDLHGEVSAVETFSHAIDTAFADFKEQPFGTPMLPVWRRMNRAIPGLLKRLAATFDSAGDAN